MSGEARAAAALLALLLILAGPVILHPGSGAVHAGNAGSAATGLANPDAYAPAADTSAAGEASRAAEAKNDRAGDEVEPYRDETPVADDSVLIEQLHKAIDLR